MKKLISIQTTQYSKVFSEILTRYPTADIEINYKKSDMSQEELLSKWCTNRNIKETNHFNLKQGQDELCGFFDSPDNLWFDISEIDFAKDLYSKKIIRYEIHTVLTLFERIMSFFKKSK